MNNRLSVKDPEDNDDDQSQASEFPSILEAPSLPLCSLSQSMDLDCDYSHQHQHQDDNNINSNSSSNSNSNSSNSRDHHISSSFGPLHQYPAFSYDDDMAEEGTHPTPAAAAAATAQTTSVLTSASSSLIQDSNADRQLASSSPSPASRTSTKQSNATTATTTTTTTTTTLPHNQLHNDDNNNNNNNTATATATAIAIATATATATNSLQSDTPKPTARQLSQQTDGNSADSSTSNHPYRKDGDHTRSSSESVQERIHKIPTTSSTTRTIPADSSSSAHPTQKRKRPTHTNDNQNDDDASDCCSASSSKSQEQVESALDEIEKVSRRKISSEESNLTTKLDLLTQLSNDIETEQAAERKARHGHHTHNSTTANPPQQYITATTTAATKNQDEANTQNSADHPENNHDDVDDEEWCYEQHREFVQAIFEVGLKQCSPSVIMEHMCKPLPTFVTRERAKSHLQKYRKTKERSRDEFMEEYDDLLKMARTMEHSGNKSTAKTKTTDKAQPLSPSTVLKALAEKQKLSQQLLSGQVAAMITYSAKNNCTSHNLPQPPSSKSKEDAMLPKLTEEEKRSSIGMSLLYVVGTLKHMTNNLHENRASGMPTTMPGLVAYAGGRNVNNNTDDDDATAGKSSLASSQACNTGLSNDTEQTTTILRNDDDNDKGAGRPSIRPGVDRSFDYGNNERTKKRRRNYNTGRSQTGFHDVNESSYNPSHNLSHSNNVYSSSHPHMHPGYQQSWHGGMHYPNHANMGYPSDPYRPPYPHNGMANNRMYFPNGHGPMIYHGNGESMHPNHAQLPAPTMSMASIPFDPRVPYMQAMGHGGRIPHPNDMPSHHQQQQQHNYPYHHDEVGKRGQHDHNSTPVGSAERPSLLDVNFHGSFADSPANGSLGDSNPAHIDSRETAFDRIDEADQDDIPDVYDPPTKYDGSKRPGYAYPPDNNFGR